MVISQMILPSILNRLGGCSNITKSIWFNGIMNFINNRMKVVPFRDGIKLVANERDRFDRVSIVISKIERSIVIHILVL